MESLIFLCSKLKSKYCPPAIPACPEHLDRKEINLVLFLIFSLPSAIISNARANNEFPAKTAVASPNFLCVESLPLLISSLSMQGKSSWIKE